MHVISNNRSVKGLVVERVPPGILQLLEAAGRAADAEGMAAYAVGGFVRDLLLRIENTDVDVVVEGDGLTVARRLAEMVGARLRPHEQFGTAVLVLPDGLLLDVATARREYYEYPAAPPVVEPSSLKDDLFRRDFTINTLAITLNRPEPFHLVDLFEGRRDLKDRTVRVFHDLSFIEDPARVLRAIRFEQRFDFTIEPQTLALLKNAVEGGSLGQIAPARLGAELRYILEVREPLKMVRRMAGLDVLRFIHPALAGDGDRWALLQSLQEVVAWYEPLCLDVPPFERWFTYILALVDPLSSEDARAVGIRVALPPKLQQVLEAFGQHRRGLVAALDRLPPPRPSEVYRTLKGIAPEPLLVLMAREGEGVRRRISHYLTTTQDVEPSIGGDDLIALGLEPGPRFTEILEAVRDRRVDGELATKDEEIAFVRETYLPRSR